MQNLLAVRILEAVSEQEALGKAIENIESDIESGYKLDMKVVLETPQTAGDDAGEE